MSEATLKHIAFDDIVVCENVSREHYSGIGELAHAIKQNGWVSPFTVEQTDRGYELVQGYRRYLAVKYLLQTGDTRWKKVPAQVFKKLLKAQRAMLNVAENAVRREVTPYEFIMSVRHLKIDCGMPIKAIAQCTDKGEGYITSCFKAATQLHPTILAALKNQGHRPIIGLNTLFSWANRDFDAQLQAFERYQAPTPQRHMKTRAQVIKQLRDAPTEEARQVLRWVIGDATEPWEVDHA